MKDREFLIWIHERLVHAHKENPLADYMHKLRAIILNTPRDNETSNITVCSDINWTASGWLRRKREEKNGNP